MKGFLNNKLNVHLRNSLFNAIIKKLLHCSGLMEADCISDGIKLENDENKIRNRLVDRYLNNDNIKFLDLNVRFIPEALETLSSDDTFLGRTDIKVVAKDWFKNSNSYYTIECKRIDGSKSLNKKYINDGVARFVKPMIVYPSHKGKNIIFGFVVRNINVLANAKEINSIQKEELKKIILKDLSLLFDNEDKQYIYSGLYKLNNKQLELNHVFYNFSSVIDG